MSEGRDARPDVYYEAAEAHEVATDRRVLRVDEIVPALVAELGGLWVEPTMSVNRTVAIMRSASADGSSRSRTP